MKRRVFFFTLLALSFHASADTPGQALWYLRSATGQMHPAWFEPGARTMELHVLERGVPRVSQVQFDDGGFVERPAGAPPRYWKLDGLTWRAADGTLLIPAWVIPGGRGPGH